MKNADSHVSLLSMLALRPTIACRELRRVPCELTDLLKLLDSFGERQTSHEFAVLRQTLPAMTLSKLSASLMSRELDTRADR